MKDVKKYVVPGLRYMHIIHYKILSYCPHGNFKSFLAIDKHTY